MSPRASRRRPVVVPIDPLQGGHFHRVAIAPWSLAADHLGLEQADDRLGHRVVVGVAHRADRGLRTDLGEPFGVANRGVLGPASEWWTTPGSSVRSAAAARSNLQRVRGQVGIHARRAAPPGDQPRVDVDADRHVDEPSQVATSVKATTHNSSGRRALNFRLIRSSGRAAAGLPWSCGWWPRGWRRPDPRRASDVHRAPGDRGALTVQLFSHLASPIDAVVLAMDSADFDHQFLVADHPSILRRRSSASAISRKIVVD